MWTSPIVSVNSKILPNKNQSAEIRKMRDVMILAKVSNQTFYIIIKPNKIGNPLTSIASVLDQTEYLPMFEVHLSIYYV